MTTDAQPNPYDALALIYDRWQARYGRFADLVLPRLTPLLEAESKLRPDEDVPFAFADVGCGSGTLLLQLATAHPGWRLCGLDASAAMLDSARRKPGAMGIQWQHTCMGAPLPPPRFHAAGSFFNALNNLPGRSELAATFSSVANALHPGGLFVFDVNNETGYRLWWNDRSTYGETDWSFHMDTSFERGSRHAQGRAVVICRGQRHELMLSERCFDDDEIEVCLMSSGFAVERREPWAPYAADEPGKTWWLARRV